MPSMVVLFGGRSAEHEVSCLSAASVVAALPRSSYEVTTIGITRDGAWVLADPADGPPEGPEVDPRQALARTDVVFPVLHGPLGEDGTVQGLLEVAGVPYVGCGVLASALAADKAMAKVVLAAAGVPVVPWQAVRHGTSPVEVPTSWPVFVKPASLGSSVGVRRVDGPEGLGPAMELAWRYDEWLLVEEAVAGRELECGVLGTVEPSTTRLGEVVPGAEFYDYDDKYSGAGAALVVPADVPPWVHESARSLAVQAFEALRCDGLARVDFFWEEGGRGLLLNEVNTMPGFTPHSMYPRLWEAEGVPYPELLDRLVHLAFERHRRRASRR